VVELFFFILFFNTTNYSDILVNKDYRNCEELTDNDVVERRVDCLQLLQQLRYELRHDILVIPREMMI